MLKHLLTKQEWKHRSVQASALSLTQTNYKREGPQSKILECFKDALLHCFCCCCFVLCLLQNHWFTYNETMTVESVTQAVSNLALQFGEEDADPGAMVKLFPSLLKWC